MPQAPTPRDPRSYFGTNSFLGQAVASATSLVKAIERAGMRQPSLSNSLGRSTNPFFAIRSETVSATAGTASGTFVWDYATRSSSQALPKGTVTWMGTVACVVSPSSAGDAWVSLSDFNGEGDAAPTGFMRLSPSVALFTTAGATQARISSTDGLPVATYAVNLDDTEAEFTIDATLILLPAAGSV